MKKGRQILSLLLLLLLLLLLNVIFLCNLIQEKPLFLTTNN